MCIRAYAHTRVCEDMHAHIRTYATTSINAFGHVHIVGASANTRACKYASRKRISLARIREYENTRIREYENARIREYKNARMREYTYARLHAYTRRHVYCVRAHEYERMCSCVPSVNVRAGVAMKRLMGMRCVCVCVCACARHAHAVRATAAALASLRRCMRERDWMSMRVSASVRMHM
jgi:hypothetical protein